MDDRIFSFIDDRYLLLLIIVLEVFFMMWCGTAQDRTIEYIKKLFKSVKGGFK